MSREFKVGDRVKWVRGNVKYKGVIDNIDQSIDMAIVVATNEGGTDCFTIDGKYYTTDDDPTLKHRKPKKPKHTIIADSVPRPYLTRRENVEAAADKDGWIEHWSDTNTCPVDKGLIVDIKWPDGSISKECHAGTMNWQRHKGDIGIGSIIAYRIHKD